MPVLHDAFCISLAPGVSGDAGAERESVVFVGETSCSSVSVSIPTNCDNVSHAGGTGTMRASPRLPATKDDEWSRALSLAFRAGRERWPRRFCSHRAFEEHATRLRVSMPCLAAHGTDLYLALGCAQGNAAAIRTLERDLLRASGPAIARIGREASFIDEVLQQFRERLLVAPSLMIARYSATGPLAAWLRVSVIRLALNAKKADSRWRSRSSVGPEDNPEGARSGGSRRVIQSALDEAMAELDPDCRAILRLFYLEGRNIDRIAEFYAVHRATVARRLVHARERLGQRVISKVQDELALTRDEAKRELAEIHLLLEVNHL
jgi:RNA polymerase sigma-70 factor, ECF subfamily